ncbi:MAG: cyclic nucleotide-binding domain-containing protein [Gammaproteobacteria bacterium]|nr:cyclic nucleotide-binding domain-containing protein [Gammaproteobacteria bacterium]
MTQDEIANYLRSHAAFSNLDPAHIDILVQHAQERSFVVGDLLFRQMDLAEHFFILMDGSIKVQVPAIMGPALVVQTLGAGDILGWSWLIAPYKWTFEAMAELDSRVLVFDGKALLQHCETDYNFGYTLMKMFAGLMSERLHAARIKMMDSWSPAGWA